MITKIERVLFNRLCEFQKENISIFDAQQKLLVGEDVC